jgi:predicted metal-dependent hydrolase
VTDQIFRIFEESYRQLRPRAPIPEIVVEFFPFSDVSNTIRLRNSKLLVRLSDVLESAPESVLSAIAHILLAKIYRKPIQREPATRYRRYVSSSHLREKAHLIKQARGRKRLVGAQGRAYNLDTIFDDLNRRFFNGLLGRPQMTWSQDSARNSLGHYDPAHNTIVISRIFDHHRVPAYAIEYIIYHEMLHLKYPVRLKGSRRCVHPPEFREEERNFPQLANAKEFIRHF